MSQFEREDRYIVLKRKHLSSLPSELQIRLKPALEDAAALLPKLECVVVESDWPEYEPTWAAIERRMSGRTAPDFIPGEVEEVGDCGKWAACITDESYRKPNQSAWYSRITVLGDSATEATALRRRVLAALNATPEVEVSAPAQWDGEGLPPVGTVCEYKRGSGWEKVEVFAVKPNVNGSTSALFTYECGEWTACAEPSFFRPIRTPEQIAAEEREKAIEDLYFTINWAEGRETWPMIAEHRKADYAKAIDAGYRKQVAPKTKRVLTDEAQSDRDEFERYTEERGGCSCHINPPCGHCTHPGNPMNQEDEACWREVAI